MYLLEPHTEMCDRLVCHPELDEGVGFRASAGRKIAHRKSSEQMLPSGSDGARPCPALQVSL